MNVYRLASIFFFACGLFLLGNRLFKLEQKHHLQLYFMPKCPYGLDALKKCVALAEANSSQLDLEVEYIGMDRLKPGASIGEKGNGAAGCENLSVIGKDPESLYFGRFSSLHGPEEVEEGMREICILTIWPTKWISYLKSYADNPSSNWENRCLAANIPPNYLKEELRKKSNVETYANSLWKSSESGASLSPTIVFDGKRITCQDSNYGCLDTLIVRTIRPHAVEKMDKEKIFFIYPHGCSACSVTDLNYMLDAWIDHLEIQQIDLSDSFAQKLLSGLKFSAFPVLVMPAEIVQKNWASGLAKLPLTKKNGFLYCSLDNPQIPFRLYGKIRIDNSGVFCSIDHKSEALWLQKRGYSSKALAEYWQALAVNEANPQILNNLASIFITKASSQDLAVGLFLKALKINNEYGPALSNLADYYFNNGHSDLGKEYLSRLGWSLAKKHMFKESLPIFTRLIGIDSHDYTTNKGLAWSLVELNREAEALPYLEYCERNMIKEDSDIYLLLGGYYFRIADYPRAEVAYAHCNHDAKHSTNAIKNLLFLYERNKNWQEILDITCDNEKDGLTSIFRDEALWETGASEKSIRDLVRLKKDFPQYRQKIRRLLASFYYQDHQFGLSSSEIKSFCVDLIIFPDDQSQSCVELSDLALKLRRPDLSKQCLEYVLLNHPAIPQVHRQLSMLYHFTGNYDAEKTELELFKEFGG